MNRFHAYLAGFSRDFGSLDEVLAWANGLVSQYAFVQGQTLKIHKAMSVRVAKDGSGSVAIYSGKPGGYREIVIGG